MYLFRLSLSALQKHVEKFFPNLYILLKFHIILQYIYIYIYICIYTVCRERERERRRRRLKGIHSRSDANRTGAEGLFFYYSRLLHCLNQMLAVVLLSHHRVSSSKTVRSRAPCGARCIGHAVRTWSAVCSEAPHSQFGEEVRPHLCIEE